MRSLSPYMVFLSTLLGLFGVSTILSETRIAQGANAVRSNQGLAYSLVIAPAGNEVEPSPQPKKIRVEFDLPVGPATDYALVEPHLSVDPTNPDHFVAAALARGAVGNQNLGCVAFSSFDGGRSWSATKLNPPGLNKCGDPWTVVLRDGTALISYLGEGGIVILRSSDGGRTWSEPASRLLGPHDHPMLLVDSASNAVFIVSGLSTKSAQQEVRSSVFVARSTDGGRSFSERGRAVISNLSYEALTPILLSNGSLVPAAIDHHDASDRALERRRAWLLLSSDSGATFAEPMLVTESCSRTRFASWPSLIASSSHTSSAERLIFTCEADDNQGILMARSDDQGNRWTAAARIDGGIDLAWTKTRAMAVSAAGLLAVTWLDGRDDTRGKCWHLYGTISLDGGATFLKPQRLSDTRSCPTATRSGEGVLGRFPAGGEYYGLVSIGPSQFLAVWPDARDGRFQLRSVRFSAAEP